MAIDWSSKFCSSKVSTRSEFQIIESSVTCRLSRWSMASCISLTPSSSTSPVRKTAQLFCMTRCISRRKSAVRTSPLACRNLSSRSSDFCSPPSGTGRMASLGSTTSAQCLAAERPKTTKSSNEFEPRRLAPCTDTQAASPIAINPGTVVASPLVLFRTSP